MRNFVDTTIPDAFVDSIEIKPLGDTRDFKLIDVCLGHNTRKIRDVKGCSIYSVAYKIFPKTAINLDDFINIAELYNVRRVKMNLEEFVWGTCVDDIVNEYIESERSKNSKTRFVLDLEFTTINFGEERRGLIHIVGAKAINFDL